METARVHEAPQPPSLDGFGARLAIIRWAQRWNLKEAALACNLPQASWREWELFDRAPRNIVEVAGKIAARTGYGALNRSVAPRSTAFGTFRVCRPCREAGHMGVRR